MMNSYRDVPAFGNWMPALAMLALTLLAVAALLNGIGRLGVMATPDPGRGQYLSPQSPALAERVDFSQVDRTIRRLPVDEQGNSDSLASLEPLLMALSAALKDAPVVSGPALERAQFLLRRSLPRETARPVNAILPDFLRYQRAETALFHYRLKGPQSIEAAYAQSMMQQALRRMTLGPDVADALYGQIHRLTGIHLLRQMLMEREDLADEEKQEMLRQQMEALAAPESEDDAG
ncbi:lipase chaperone protein [Marinobacter daqiaonensis]|uniref:Lipase chaperone n=1 Tax=Marinobacter daqiaonensis TaxID=650891 RepID=A0A1I6JVT8_9GAMM|nr:lipase secretion chaperone [Marinobacter daqiaonensis]SFR83056.1 lipase chaperone protein [Marinobacter daqiaonensis]